MSIIKFKSGVQVPKVAIIACAVINAANLIPFFPDIVVTSGNDSRHMPGSKHYTNEALDFRTKHLTSEQKRDLIVAAQARLGADYQLILEAEGTENEHLHCEYDPLF